MPNRPRSLELAMADYLLKKRLIKREERFPFTLMLEPLELCNLACHGLRPHPRVRARLRQAAVGGGVPAGGRGGRRADREHPRRRAADPQADRRDRQRHHRARGASSTCAPTACSWTAPSGASRPRTASRSWSTSTACARCTTRRSRARACSTRRPRTCARPSRCGYRVCTNTTIFRGVPAEEYVELFAFLQGHGRGGVHHLAGLRLRVGHPRPRAVPRAPGGRRRSTPRCTTAARTSTCPSTTTRSSTSSCRASASTAARRGRCRPTRSRAGGAPATCSPTRTSAASRSSTRGPTGRPTAPDRDPRCANCLMHCGYEATTILEAFNSPKDLVRSHAGDPRRRSPWSAPSRRSAGPCAGWSGPGCALHVGGMGAAAAAPGRARRSRRGRRARSSPPASAARSTPALRVGDLVAAERVRRRGHRASASRPTRVLLAAAPGRRGTLVSARRIARTPADRARLRRPGGRPRERRPGPRVARRRASPSWPCARSPTRSRHRLPDFDGDGRPAPAAPARRRLALLRRCATRGSCPRLAPARPGGARAPAGRCADGLDDAAREDRHVTHGTRDRGDRVHRPPRRARTCSPTGGRCAPWCGPRAWADRRWPDGVRAGRRRRAATRDVVRRRRARLRRGLPRRRALLAAPQRAPREVERTNVAGHRERRSRPRAAAGAQLVHTSSVATIGVPADGSSRRRGHAAAPRASVIGAYKRSKVASERLVAEAAARRPVGGDREPDARRSDRATGRPTPTGRIVLDFLRGRMRGVRRHRPQPRRRARRGRRPPPRARARHCRAAGTSSATRT